MYGVFDIDSVPPARITSASPRAICCQAWTIPIRLEEHAWLIVYAGEDSGTPARSAICRAGFGPAPACRPWPKIVRSTSAGSSPARSRHAEATCAPRSGAVLSTSAPPNLPIGVRTGAQSQAGRS